MSGSACRRKDFWKACGTLCDKNGALLIFDEVKTGAKLGWGGASEYFDMKPDIVCLAKSIGGGFPLAAFGTHKRSDGADLGPQSLSRRDLQHESGFDGGGHGDFREVLTRGELHAHDKLSKKLVEGYTEDCAKSGLAGVRGRAPGPMAR